MKRLWLWLGASICCAALALFSPLHQSGDGKILLVQDAFDPMAEILEPHAASSIERLNPYQLGKRLPGLNGAALVFGTQARHFDDGALWAGGEYTALYTTTVVIAVRKEGNSAGAIRGWRSLLESEAVVLPPHHGTEGGRLAAIALARGLGAAEGDLGPALKAYTALQRQNRLNDQEQYHSRDFRAMFDPERLAEHDAVILWDYQAAALQRISPGWEVVIPEEGTLAVDCGLLFSGHGETVKKMEPLKAYLLSAEGRQALRQAGFSPLASRADLAAWDRARLTFNPSFRRNVLTVKRSGPASLQERLLLQSLTLLLFSIAAQRILRRIPAGLYRTTSFYSMLLILLWMLTGMAKALAPTPGLTRYLWFSTYLARHGLPLCWLLMCYVNRYKRLPPRSSLAALAGGALLLTLFVLTNDLHRSVFVYAGEASATWSEDYINGWGYYLSLAWVFILSLAGMALLIDKKRTRQQQRRLLYAGLFFLVLLLYQWLYIAEVKHIVDLDIPTTIAMLVLAFILAAQRERFMGSSLLHLPLFHNSPYAISIFDNAGREVYKNSLMETLQRQGAALPCPSSATADFAPLYAGGRVFKSRTYMLDRGRALLLEDITILQQLERSLKRTHQKLGALQELLMQQAGETCSLTSRMEQERYSEQMDRLFRNKLTEVQRHLHLARGAAAGEQRRKIMRRARFLLSICQQRLRFIIRSLEEHPLLPVQLVKSYAAGVISDGGRRGLLDGAATADARGCCPPVLAGLLLESIDCFCLDVFDSPGRSLICRLEADAAGLTLSALLSTEAEMPPAERDPLPETLSDAICRLGGRVLREADEEALQIRLIFIYGEVRDDLVHHPGGC